MPRVSPRRHTHRLAYLHRLLARIRHIFLHPHPRTLTLAQLLSAGRLLPASARALGVSYYTLLRAFGELLEELGWRKRRAGGGDGGAGDGGGLVKRLRAEIRELKGRIGVLRGRVRELQRDREAGGIGMGGEEAEQEIERLKSEIERLGGRREEAVRRAREVEGLRGEIEVLRGLLGGGGGGEGGGGGDEEEDGDVGMDGEDEDIPMDDNDAEDIFGGSPLFQPDDGDDDDDLYTEGPRVAPVPVSPPLSDSDSDTDSDTSSGSDPHICRDSHFPPEVAADCDTSAHPHDR